MVSALIPFVALGLVSACILADAAAALAKTYRKESYSTSVSEVNNQDLLLDTYPFQSYTHYLQSSEWQMVYNFTIHVRQNGTGMFISAWELVENKTDSSDSGLKTKESKICSKYWIKFSYPEDKAKQPTYLCKRGTGEYTDDVYNILALEDYKGPGSVFVEITYVGFYEFGGISLFDRGSGTPWRSTSGRSIPAKSIGGLTFTLYQDCSEPAARSNLKNLNLRPCSKFHNMTCIARGLFCNGELNCVTSIWDILLNPDVLDGNGTGTKNTSTNSSSDSLMSYDESASTCRGTTHQVWTRTVYTSYGSGSYGSGSYGGGSYGSGSYGDSVSSYGGGSYGSGSYGDSVSSYGGGGVSSGAGRWMVGGFLLIVFSGLASIARCMKRKFGSSGTVDDSPSMYHEPRPLLRQGLV